MPGLRARTPVSGLRGCVWSRARGSVCLFLCLESSAAWRGGGKREGKGCPRPCARPQGLLGGLSADPPKPGSRGPCGRCPAGFDFSGEGVPTSGAGPRRTVGTVFSRVPAPRVPDLKRVPREGARRPRAASQPSGRALLTSRAKRCPPLGRGRSRSVGDRILSRPWPRVLT